MPKIMNFRQPPKPATFPRGRWTRGDNSVISGSPGGCMRKTAKRAKTAISDSSGDAALGLEAMPGLEAMRDLYRMVLLIRRSEERLKELLAEGLVPGFIHLSIGQEAVAAGVMSALLPADT